jgi:hypothetical protein
MFDLEEKVGAAVKMTVCMTAVAVAVVTAFFFFASRCSYGRSSNTERSRLRSCSPFYSLSSQSRQRLRHGSCGGVGNNANISHYATLHYGGQIRW